MSAPTNFVSLADAIRKAGDPLTMLRTSATGPFAFPRVPREVTNWRDEQEAWHSSCALIDMSYHQTDLFLRGPGVLDLLMQVGVNRFAGFPVGSAKQLVCAAPSGLHVTDGIVMRLEEDCYRLVGAQPVSDWVQYHAESGGWDVSRMGDGPGARRRPQPAPAAGEAAAGPPASHLLPTASTATSTCQSSCRSGTQHRRRTAGHMLRPR
jgi:vanillate/3-O-methylgallate O-demethylase